MIRFVDSILNRVTMYKLVLYELIGLLLAAGILSVFGLLSFGPFYLAYSVAILFAACFVVNKIFAYFYDAPSNPESTYITALILSLLITPPHAFTDSAYLSLAGWAAAWAIASKYIVAIQRKHIFNPAAFGIAVTAFFLNQSASWWVGTAWMLPFVIIGGVLVARKIRRLDLVFAFLGMVTLTILFLSAVNPLHTVQQAFLFAPVVFFATVMLTEPLTAPAQRFWRILFAVLVGFFFAPEVHFGSFYFTPELALLAGNLFAYAVGPKQKLFLTLKDRIILANGSHEFVFTPNRPLAFDAGQYLEWTLPHAKRDLRGIRRYFTIASSPHDADIRIGVKFYEPMSSFKKALMHMQIGDTVVAGQLAGDFILPAQKEKKLVFIAGGIGVTPFRSMIQYLLDAREKRDITLIYSNRSPEDEAYGDLLDTAEREIGLKTVRLYNPTLLTREILEQEVPDYAERAFYISGPNSMVVAFSELIESMGVAPRRIKKDYFPGF